MLTDHTFQEQMDKDIAILFGIKRAHVWKMVSHQRNCRSQAITLPDEESMLLITVNGLSNAT